MKEIVQQLPSLLELPLPDLAPEMIMECIGVRMFERGLAGDYDAYEQLLQIDKEEVSLLLCEFLQKSAAQKNWEKESLAQKTHQLEVLQASLDSTIYEVSADYELLNEWRHGFIKHQNGYQGAVGKKIKDIYESGVSRTVEMIIDQVLQTEEHQIYTYWEEENESWKEAHIQYLSLTGDKEARVSISIKEARVSVDEKDDNIRRALEQSEKRYKILVENSPQAIVVHAEEKVLFANQKALELLGEERIEELQQRSVLDLVHPDDRKLVAQRIKDIYSKKKDAPLRVGRFIQASGEFIHVEVLGCMIEYEGKPAAQIVFRDITDEVEAQARLLTHDRILKGVNEASSYLLAEKNEKLAITQAINAVMNAANANRAYVFENHTNALGELRVSQRYETFAKGFDSIIEEPAFQNLSYEEIGFKDEVEILKTGTIVGGEKQIFSARVQELMEMKGVTFMTLIPIFLEESFWGIFGLSSVEHMCFLSDSELELLKNVGHTIGNSIAKRQVEACEQLEYEVSRILSQADNGNEAIDCILKEICTLLDWEIGELWLPDDLEQKLELRNNWYDNQEKSLKGFVDYSKGFYYQLDEGVVGKAWTTGIPNYSGDINPNESCRRTPSAVEVGIHSRIAIPIRLNNQSLGVLCFISTSFRELSDVYLRTFTSIGIQIGQFIKRKQAEKLYKDLVDAVPAVVWRLDVESFSFTYVSHQAEQMLGYPVENWIGNSTFWASHVHPDDRDYALKYCGECTAKKIDHDFEYRMIRKDGHVIWIADYVHVVVKDDKPVELIGLLIDITEQKEAENALALSKERLKLAVEGAELGLWDWSIPDDYVYSSEAMAKMLEYSEEEMPSKFGEMFEWVHPDDRERVQRAISSHLNGENSIYQDEFRLKTKSGKWKWLLDIGKVIERDKIGTPLRMLGIHRDIDERKRAEEYLRISEERLSLALKGIGICDWNVQSDELYLNDTWTEYLGFLPGEIQTSKKYFELIHPEDFSVMTQELNRHLQGESHTFRTELRIKSKIGNYIWVLNQGEVVEWDTSGKPIRFVSTYLDISEIKNYQRKIQDLNKDLEKRVDARTAELMASNEDLENFAYSISHDLRAPLRHINGYSRLLSQRSDNILDENTKEFVGFIADAALKLSKQIEDLLQYSRIGRKEIKVENIRVDDMIRQQASILEKENSDRSITFKIDSLPNIKGDSLLIEQLFHNLLSNAVKYTRGEKQTRIKVGVQSKADQYIFFVKDNGVGFDQAYSHKLFQVFKRLHGESEFEGTGIGLANVYRIVQRHGGKVWGESKLGKGATFFVSLPK